MLERFSMSMMVLLVGASLIGISSIYQPTDVVTQSRSDLTIDDVGTVLGVWAYASSDGKACVAVLAVPNIRVHFKLVFLVAPDESICDLFGKAKISEDEDERRLMFAGNWTDYSALPPGFKTILPPVDLYRVHSVVLI
jgi:hypothetical protein